MHSKRQIQQLLAATGASPKKKLGQHFLIDLNLLNLVADSAGITPDDIVLEIGCGTGSMTQELAQKARTVIAIEYDPVLAAIAAEQVKDTPNILVLNCDALAGKSSLNPTVKDAIDSAAKHTKGRLLLVANLPYCVASAIIVNMAAGPIVADEMHITVQKEVAHRMTAPPGRDEYGPMAILLAAAGNAQIDRILKPTVFWPQPQVDSALVHFVRDPAKTAQISDFDLLADVVNLFMGHRRKTMQACTKLAAGNPAQTHDWPAIFAAASINPTLRPDQLSPQQYVELANGCHSSQ
jgi:16S rRNA (adenine1518-N6/adenine1519-N6)-dimethyltransferase